MIEVGSGCAAILFFAGGGRDFNGFEYRVTPILKLNGRWLSQKHGTPTYSPHLQWRCPPCCQEAAASNSRGIHLSAAEIGTRQVLQRRWAFDIDIVSGGQTLCDHSVSILLRSQIPVPQFTAAIDQIIDMLTLQAVAYLVQTQQWLRLDSDLYDIPLQEYLQNREFRPRQHLRIDNIESDLHARKMTRFNLHQLRRIYDCFGLDDYCRSMNIDFIRVYTGHDNQRGVPCCYRFHPEELFLYSLTKIATGNTSDDNVDHYFGGAYSRWCLGFPCSWIFSINSYVKMSSEASSEISSQATQISETTPTQQATQLADDVT
eukprot:scaffold604_cov111-Skeletonema_dohrnii-CCMP3373.AAC.9